MEVSVRRGLTWTNHARGRQRERWQTKVWMRKHHWLCQRIYTLLSTCFLRTTKGNDKIQDFTENRSTYDRIFFYMAYRAFLESGAFLESPDKQFVKMWAIYATKVFFFPWPYEKKCLATSKASCSEAPLFTRRSVNCLARNKPDKFPGFEKRTPETPFLWIQLLAVRL